MSERFDGAAAWAALSPEAQMTIGATALELVAARLAEKATDDFLLEIWETPEHRAAKEARWRLGIMLVDAVTDVVADDAFLSPDGLPKLPSRLGQVCRGCGCSDFDPCPDSCEWVAGDLCSACADRGMK